MTIEEKIMKLQTYKMYEGEDTVYVERDDILKLLEQQPKMQDCEHCIHTYGTLGCCDMVDNNWIYDCEFGKEQYKKEHESQPCEDCISKEKMIKVIERMEKLEEDLYRTEGAESSFATLCLCVEWIKEALE